MTAQYWGALAAATDAPFILVVALVAAVAVALQGRKPWPHRLRLAFVRGALIVMIAIMLASLDLFCTLMITGCGPALHAVRVEKRQALLNLIVGPRGGAP